MERLFQALQHNLPFVQLTFPTLNNDAEAEAFLEKADLSEYDLSEMISMRFELKPKDKVVNLRLPSQLLDAVRRRARAPACPISDSFASRWTAFHGEKAWS